MDLKEQLIERLKKGLVKYLEAEGVEAEKIEPAIETPRNREHGDFSTNMAMQLTRALKRNRYPQGNARVHAVGYQAEEELARHGDTGRP